MQRKTGTTGYKKLLKGKNVPAADAGTIADASISVAVKDEIRTKSEKGHGWIEIELRQPWAKLDPATKQQLEANMGDPTKRLLPTGGYTSVGFYPKDPNSKTATIATAGKILEPEKAYMLANTTAKMTFPVGVKALGKLLKFVRDAEASPPIYSFLANNCTTWAVNAIKQTGKNASSFLGKVTSRTVTAPGKFYKRAYERAALGLPGASVDATLGSKEKRLVDEETEKKLAAVGAKKPTGTLELSADADDANSDLASWKKDNRGSPFEDGVKAGRINALKIAGLDAPDLARLERIHAGQLDVMGLVDLMVQNDQIRFGAYSTKLTLEEIVKLRGDLATFSDLPAKKILELEETPDWFRAALVFVLRQPRTAIDQALGAAANQPHLFPKEPSRGGVFKFSSGATLATAMLAGFVKSDQDAGQVKAALGTVEMDERERLVSMLAGRLGQPDDVVRAKFAKIGMAMPPLPTLPPPPGLAPPPGQAPAPQVGGTDGGTKSDEGPEELSDDTDQTPQLTPQEAIGKLKEHMEMKYVVLDAPWMIGGKSLPAGAAVAVTRATQGDSVQLEAPNHGGRFFVPAVQAWQRLEPLAPTAKPI